MDIAELQAFVRVAEAGSFSLAAEQLHLTQPAVSKRVAALEDELRTRLFDRIGRQTHMTEAGRALLEHARHILLSVEDSRRAITRLSGHISGQLSIATSHHIGLHRLPPVLSHYTAEYPDVELDLHFMDSEEACHAVEQGDLELGVVTLPLQLPRRLKSKVIWQDPLKFVVSAQHPLSVHKKISIQSLAEHGAILPAHGTYTRSILESALSSDDSGLHVYLSTNYLETIKMMVSVGLGWSILPETMIDNNLHVLQVEKIHLHRQLGVVSHTQRTLSNAATEFIETLQSYSA